MIEMMECYFENRCSFDKWHQCRKCVLTRVFCSQQVVVQFQA